MGVRKKQKRARAVSFKALLARGAALAAMAVCIIAVLEKKRIFVEDSANNHEEWKWDWYVML